MTTIEINGKIYDVDKERIADDLAQLQCQLNAATRSLWLKTGEKKTQAEYKITFLQGKIKKLQEYLG